MHSNEYVPAPVNLEQVELPAELEALAELISKNVHEVWAQQRIRDGWVYGPERNDERRITPCLVPYEALPEEEKVYDRNTALSALKYIVSLGFEIKKKER